MVDVTGRQWSEYACAFFQYSAHVVCQWIRGGVQGHTRAHTPRRRTSARSSSGAVARARRIT
eukprot:7658-Eustigmatos_ZCMA.PRE.1